MCAPRNSQTFWPYKPHIKFFTRLWTTRWTFWCIKETEDSRNYWETLFDPLCSHQSVGAWVWVGSQSSIWHWHPWWEMGHDLIPVLSHGFMECPPQPVCVAWQRCAHKIPSVMWGPCEEECLGQREEGQSWRSGGERPMSDTRSVQKWHRDVARPQGENVYFQSRKICALQCISEWNGVLKFPFS